MQFLRTTKWRLANVACFFVSPRLWTLQLVPRKELCYESYLCLSFICYVKLTGNNICNLPISHTQCVCWMCSIHSSFACIWQPLHLLAATLSTNLQIKLRSKTVRHSIFCGGQTWKTSLARFNISYNLVLQ